LSDARQVARTALGGETVPTTVTRLAKAYGILANLGRAPGTDGKQVVSRDSAAAVRRALVEVVTRGTGTRAAIQEIQVAGKTGTSAAGDDGVQLATFGGFAPADSPTLALFIVVESGYDNSGGPASGGTAAAPIFREIVRRGHALASAH
jgi:peptidoglycan glycosyltransferase